MRDFLCPSCGQRLAFENFRCLNCGGQMGFDLASREFVLLCDPAPFRRCANALVAACNWVIPGDAFADLCVSCALTRTRPSDADAIGLEEFAQAEAAKRRLVVELTELGLPILGRDQHPETGLCFDLLSSSDEPVITGHDEGVVTVDLAESDGVHREQLRISMEETSRTLLGHFRHEIGHYYFTILVTSEDAHAQFTKLFGDPDLDYQQALDRHYSVGAPAGWPDRFVSSYATSIASSNCGCRCHGR